MNDISLTDNLLHVAGGALLALPLVGANPIALFFVFSVWGLLREQAQKHIKGMPFEQNWLGIWNMEKAIEGFSWGIGAFLVGLFLNLFNFIKLCNPFICNPFFIF